MLVGLQLTREASVGGVFLQRLARVAWQTFTSNRVLSNWKSSGFNGLFITCTDMLIDRQILRLLRFRQILLIRLSLHTDFAIDMMQADTHLPHCAAS